MQIARSSAVITLPPYGAIPEFDLTTDLPQPPQFRTPDGDPVDPAEWVAWLEALADELATFLWPRYSGGQWVGAAPDPEALTRADLALLRRMWPILQQPISAASTVTHRTMFLVEDPEPPSVSGFLHYAPAAPAGLLEHFRDDLLAGGAQMARPVSRNLKRRMQRPRPYQCALMLRMLDGFDYLAASSATSPALVSGHCIQGAAALMNVVVRFEDRSRAPMPAPLLAAVQQYFIDGGDRRVFAGVHFLTDNLSSWFCALRLARHVFRGETEQRRAREVLWQGIQGSAVFQALEDAAATDAGEAFRLPLLRLRQEADRPVGV
jgi:hypothetical protein